MKGISEKKDLESMKKKIEYLKTQLNLHKKISKVQLSLTNQWQKIFNSLGDALALIDQEGFIIECNKAMEDFIRKPAIKIIGNTCWSLIHETCEREKTCLFEKMQKKRGRVSGWVYRDNKKYKVVLDPLFDDEGKIKGAIHIFSEVKRKKIN